MIINFRTREISEDTCKPTKHLYIYIYIYIYNETIETDMLMPFMKVDISLQARDKQLKTKESMRAG